MSSELDGYFIVAGNIGVGKTTLINLLKQKGVFAIEEQREDSLAEYYVDRDSNAFLNQLSYSLQYLEIAIAIKSATGPAVIERSIYDTHEVFSKMNYQDGLISQQEFQQLERLKGAIVRIRKPKLLVFIDHDEKKCFNRIRARDVPAEREMTEGYVARLGKTYRAWFDKFTECPKLKVQKGNKKTVDFLDLSLIHI